MVALLTTVMCVAIGPQAQASAADPCAAPTNPIVCENSKPGSPSSVWDVDGAGDSTIQGFTTDISANVGSSISFKVKSPAAYTMTIYRMGYYGGDGARQIATVATTARTQPACLSDASTGLFDCGNWAVSATWAIPSTAVSGVYFALLHRNDTGGESHVPFIVRNDASHADIVYQTSDPTWQAYNTYGGNNFYSGDPAGRAYKLSYNRPYSTRGLAGGRDFVFSNEYPMIRFLESNGYDISYISGVDTDRAGALLKNHKTFISVGHDEYWSAAQRANVEAARDAGVNLAFFSGNEVYWRTRYESSIDGSGTAYRTLTCYKETWANDKIDPTSQWTGTWRDPRFTPPATGGNNPENALTGTAYMSNSDDLALKVPASQGKDRFWRNTSVASLAAGQTATLQDHTVGYESDEDLDNGFRPAGLIDLSTTVGSTPELLQDYGNVVVPGTTTHHMTLYRAPSGALVFGAGTVQYAWGLDSNHDGQATSPDPALRQATVNLFADMGDQPLTLVSGLVAATKSTDTTAPTSAITSPAAGATIANGASTTVSGTATDTGGGVVAGVEVSVDGGATWHPATGTTSWSYTFPATGSGSVTYRVRASDDSGNLQTTPATRSFTVNCPCSLFAGAVPKTPAVTDTSDVELGIRFTSSTDGLVTGVRFYKGTGNTGTHTGSLWSASGVRLATGTFTNETATGWQSLTFSSPVSISAGTTYTASYRAPAGHYSADPWSFSARDWTAAPLAAPRSIGTSHNGVFADGGNFPASSYQDSNYYVDVTFGSAATTAPAITTTAPANGATDGSRTAPIQANFNVSINSGTAAMTVKTSNGTAVAGSVALDSTKKVLSFTPSSSLAASTSYTVTVSGAVSTFGVAMTAPAGWSFTTVAPCPCTLFPSTAVPAVTDSGDTAATELGMKFIPSVTGTVTGIRFYKAAGNTGTHTGSLWSSTGSLLRTGTFTGETASGWQTLTFANPVVVTAGTAYVASYQAPNGHYSYTSGYFAADVTSGSLTAPAAGNGLYLYGSGFPTNTFSGSNYWVDVKYLDSAAPDTTPPVISNPTGGPGGSISTASVTWTTDEPGTSVVNYGTSATSLTSTASVAGLSTAHSVTLSGLASGAVYYFRVTSADSAGNSATAPASPAAPGTLTTGGCPCTVFSNSATPDVVDSGDGAAVELGMKFIPSQNGTVTGVRFYKAAANTGTHIGEVWSSTGTSLRRGTFTGETASGWQTMTFSSPLAVTANTTYVVSYLAPNGRYSVTGNYFTSDVVRQPLTAPAAGNGVYVYDGGFPNNTFNGANYWVDVTFTDATMTDTSPPVISGLAATAKAVSATVNWSTDEPSTSTVAYGSSSTSLTGTASVSGLVTNHSVTISGLAPGTTYYYRVTSADAGGNSATSPAASASPASVITTGCPCTVFPSTATPDTVDAGDTAAVELGMKFVPSVNGKVRGVKFYKAAGNTGVHTGSLWSSTGTLLGTGTFSAETASGWQTLTLSTPVSVTSGTTYVVSYSDPNGHYSASSYYFTAPVVNAPLTAPADSNGVYVYGSGYPSQTFNNTNYWVDVVFTTS